MENTSSNGFITVPNCQDHPQVLDEFWTLADWPPYLPDLNSLGVSIWSVLLVKVQVMPHANLATLQLSIAKEWD